MQYIHAVQIIGNIPLYLAHAVIKIHTYVLDYYIHIYSVCKMYIYSINYGQVHAMCMYIALNMTVIRIKLYKLVI